MELKTLKDIEAGIDEYNVKFIENLRAEAVKWIEEDRGLRKNNTIWRLNGDELLDLLEDRWMKRFNLTEEDLGEKQKEIGGKNEK